VPALDTLLKDPALAPEGLRKIDTAAQKDYLQAWRLGT
jgi:hypothetical protein